MIYITGDTHGELETFKLGSKFFPEGKKLTKNDYVIIVGDFGLVFNQEFTPNEIHWLKWLKTKSWTTLFIDGNHENFDRLFSDEFPIVPMFGDEVKKIYDDIYYLQRGRVYTIEGKTFFTMGGAPSIDKAYRIEGVSWWPQEEPSYTEWNNALTKAKEVRRVDYVLTHDCPSFIYDELIYDGIIRDKQKNSVSKGLKELYYTLEFDKWFFGHFHNDRIYGKFRLLYDEIVKL